MRRWTRWKPTGLYLEIDKREIKTEVERQMCVEEKQGAEGREDSALTNFTFSNVNFPCCLGEEKERSKDEACNGSGNDKEEWV